VPPKRAKEILRFIAENRTADDLSVTTELRVDLLDQEFMGLLKQAGISVVEIGLQSSNDAALRAVERKQSMRKITENVRYLQSIGIEVVFQLIFGLPEDTYEDYLESLDFCVGLDATKIEPYRLQLLPGTPMYDNVALLGLEFVDRGDRKIIRTRTMSKEDLERAEMLTRLLECFYDDKVARDAFKWLARHLDTSYARLLEDYMTWRLTQPSSLVAWREEGSRHLADFIRVRVPERTEAVLALVRDLLRYDHFTSPLYEIEQHVLVAFGHDVAAIAAGSDGALPARRETCLVFHKTDTASTNFFNGRFVRKSFREVPADALGSADRLRASGLDPAEIVAVAEWHLAGDRAGAADALARKVLEKAPRQADALHVLARIAAAAGRTDQALTQVKRAIKASPGVAAYHVTQGNILAGAERLPDAIKSYQKAVTLAPALVEARFNLGVCLAHCERFDEAVATLRGLIESHPDLAAGHFILGEILLAAGRAAEAAASYQRTLELHPDHPDARRGLEAAVQQIRRTRASV
jgi:Tfp pilus assembly protein PilF